MRRVWIALVCVMSLTGCVGTSVAAPRPTAAPTPTPTPAPLPSPTPTPVPLVAAPATLTFNSVGVTQSVSITGGATPGVFTVAGCAGVATFNVVSPGVFTVTSTGAGACTFTFANASLQQATIAVSVTTLSVPVN
jgi:hypothetical protein